MRLRDDPVLRARMVDNGHLRAVAYGAGSVTDAWMRSLTEVAPAVLASWEALSAEQRSILW